MRGRFRKRLLLYGYVGWAGNKNPNHRSGYDNWLPKKKNLQVLHKGRIDNIFDPLEEKDKEPKVNLECPELVNMGLGTLSTESENPGEAS